jgi:hypothetical protein
LSTFIGYQNPIGKVFHGQLENALNARILVVMDAAFASGSPRQIRGKGVQNGTSTYLQ